MASTGEAASAWGGGTSRRGRWGEGSRRWLSDEGSTTGTFVNGARRPGRTRLLANDVVHIGPYRLALRPDQPVAEQRRRWLPPPAERRLPPPPRLRIYDGRLAGCEKLRAREGTWEEPAASVTAVPSAAPASTSAAPPQFVPALPERRKPKPKATSQEDEDSQRLRRCWKEEGAQCD